MMRKKYIILASVHLTIQVTPAVAQEGTQPPIESVIDANGVDLSIGQLNLPGPRLEIGGEGSGLSHVSIGSPIFVDAVANQVDNYSDSIWTAPGPSGGDPGGPVFASVSFDGITRMFGVGTWIEHSSTQTYFSGPYNGNGPEKLECNSGIESGSGICTLYTADGGSIEYDLSYNSPVTSFSGKALRGRATKITRGDGEIVRLNYDSHRVRTVWSTLGWMFKYSYAASGELIGINSYNLSTTYCDPAAAACPTNSSYPFITIAIDGSTRTALRNGIPIYRYDRVSDWDATRYDPMWNKITYQAVSGSTDSNGRRTNFSVKRGNSEWIYSKYSWIQYPQFPYKEIVLQWDITDPEAGVRHVNVNTMSQITSITDELSRKTTFRREQDYSPTSPRPKSVLPPLLPYIIYPEGSETTGKVEYKYDFGRISEIKVLSKIAGADSLKTTYEYGCGANSCMSKPTKVTYPGGNAVEYEYSTVHRLLVKETGSADAKGVRPQKRYRYEQLSPKILDANGALVTSAPVWRLVGVSECATATAADPASCVGTAAEKVTTYTYNSNNLLRTAEMVANGDGSLSTTTTYTYDNVGNLTMLDGPRSDVDDRKFTTYDALRRPVFEIGPDPDGVGGSPRAITKHNYDSVGREYLTEFGTGAATDGSDFAVQRFQRMSFDPLTGDLVKKEVGYP